MNRWVVWLAQGFGSGRVKYGPGTVGTLVGLLWTWLLMLPGNVAVFGAGALAGVGVAVWICGRAEEILGTHDPGSVVLDEIVAVPLCFGALIAEELRHGGTLEWTRWLNAESAWVIPAVFGLFRLFDIWKPWPVRQVQALPRGWGVVTDDVLAAVWVNVPWLIAMGWKPGCCAG